MYFADIASTSSIVLFGCAWCARPSISRTLWKSGLKRRYIEAMSMVAPSILDEETVAKAVDSVLRPQGVSRGRISFDLDHAGEPAIRVIFPVSKKIALTPSRVTELAEFRRSVRDAVRALGSASFPYVSLEDAR
jgi:hypothetical protein